MAPTQRLTQPSKQQSPLAGQSVSLTPGLQQVLTLPAHNDLGSGAVLAQPGCNRLLLNQPMFSYLE